jgi:SHS2 domain-containing protein
MDDCEAGFREIDHTADWELEIWAPDETGILVQAARGMYEMSGLTYGGNGDVRRTRQFAIERPDRESLLVGFLSELLYVLQTDHLAFDRFEFELDETSSTPAVRVSAGGRPVTGVDKEIKAVTWHRIALEPTDEGWSGRVTFDV